MKSWLEKPVLQAQSSVMKTMTLREGHNISISQCMHEPCEMKTKSCQDGQKGQKKGHDFADICRWLDELFTVIQEQLPSLETSRR